MKIAYIVDSLTDFSKKIDLLISKFGREKIYFIVRADLMPFFETFDYTAHAVYYKKMSTILHLLLQNTKKDDVVICYASLHFTENLLNKFLYYIKKDENKIVSLLPNYSGIENAINSLYNKYVRSLFNIDDSLVSSKLQYIPQIFVEELMQTHISNRLFNVNRELCTFFTSEHPQVNKTAKSTYPKLKLNLIFTMSFLIITALFLLSIAYLKIKFIGYFLFIILIILNTVIGFISHFKQRFDHRFLSW